MDNPDDAERLKRAIAETVKGYENGGVVWRKGNNIYWMPDGTKVPDDGIEQTEPPCPNVKRWVIVPVTPSPEMLAAGGALLADPWCWDIDGPNVWKAMIEAAQLNHEGN